MLKFKKTTGKKKASTDSGNTQSDVSTEPQLPLMSSPAREEGQTIEQLPAIEDSKAGSNSGSAEDTENRKLSVKVAVHQAMDFFSKGVRKPAKSRTETQSEDVLGSEIEQSQATKQECHLERGTVPGGESQPQSGSVSEPRGRQSQNTRVNLSRLIERIRDRGNRTERGPRITSPFEPRPDPTTGSPSTESRAKENKTSACNRFWRPFKNCWDIFENYWRDCRCRKRLVKGIICYTICFIASLLALSLVIQHDGKDISGCILMVIIWCCIVSLTCERGCFTYMLEQKAMRKDLSSQESDNDLPLPKCFWCLCCNDEVGNQRHSQYTRKEINTTFKCEAPDVSKIDSSECPQVKRVEVEEKFSPSSESSSHSEAKSRVVEAIVHRSEMETEGNISGCEHGCQGACACPKLKEEKKSKGKVTYSRHSKKPQTNVCERCGQVSPCACGEQARTQTSKVKDVSSGHAVRKDAFRCQRHGQGVACACAEQAKNKNRKKTGF